jgi:hypothetical protein
MLIKTVRSQLPNGTVILTMLYFREKHSIITITMTWSYLLSIIWSVWTALGPTQPPIQWVPRGGGSFLGGKAAEAWSWPLTSMCCRGQRTSGAVLPLPQYAFMAWCTVKLQGQLYLYLTGSYEHGNETSDSINGGKFSWLAEWLTSVYPKVSGLSHDETTINTRWETT